jgi:uncharacterized protein (DUF1501 family)
MRCHYACNSPKHAIARRSFLGGAAAGVAAFAAPWGLSDLMRSAAAADLMAQRKQILVIFLAGGLSQLESWDPKPNTDTGGPFRKIPTSVPGLHISELLPCTAKQMHRLAVVRGVNTKNSEHDRGWYMMTTGRAKESAAEYPHLGAVAARMLGTEASPLPGHIQIVPTGSTRYGNDAAYLGPKYASIGLIDGEPPQYTTRAPAVTQQGDQRRNLFRTHVNDHFAQHRRTAETDAYTYSYDQALQLMARREVFDISKEPAKDRERYGTHEFGRHCLQARRLLEYGVPYVQVMHSNYDTHYENFDFLIEQLGEFDGTFACLVSDLTERGMLEKTLLVVMSEFGRTPTINSNYGRDHWGSAFSVVLGGCGIQKAAVLGKTNENGTAVIEHEVDHGQLFHTYLRAVGIDPTAEINVGGRDMPLADPSKSAIKELLL